MRRFLQLLRRAAVLIRGERFDRDLAEEIEFHRALEAAENQRTGMAAGDADAAAARHLGNALLLREESRDEWGWGWLDRLRGDLRYALRTLRRNRAYTAAATATLALAIGANCLMFSVADNLVLRPFPYPHPERLVFLWSEFNGSDLAYPSLADFEEFRRRNRSFDSMGASIYAMYGIDTAGYPETLRGKRAGPGFFATLGVQPRLGRGFTADDERPGSDNVVLLSDHCWRTRFHADPRVVGATLILSHNGQPRRAHTIIGVLPPELEAAYPPRVAEIWGALPAGVEDENARSMGFEVLARLKPGVGVAAAAAEVRAIGQALAPAHPRRKMTGARLAGFQENLIGDTRQFMNVLLGAVAFVLLLACANVANLALGRGAEREREMTIRAAIGAGRGRLFRQILTENVVLALAGGAVGTGLAYASARWIRALAPPRVLRADLIAVDARVLLFTLAISLATGILFGLAPAIRGSRARLQPSLGTPRGGSRRHGFLRTALVVAELALGFMLVSGAGLMINSFVRLLRVDPGFTRADLLLVQTGTNRRLLPDERDRIVAVENLLDGIRGIPGVLSVGVSDNRPLGNSMNLLVRRDSGEGRPYPFNAEGIGGDYFTAIGTPVLRGRTFGPQDGPSTEPVGIVNAAAAALVWPGGDPLDQSVSFQVGKERRMARIVGVVGDVRRRGLDRPPTPAIYLPRAQRNFSDNLDLVIRPAPGIAAAALAPVVRTRMAAVDSSFSADSVSTMEALISEQLARPRFSAAILGLFGFLAFAISVTGVCGVTAYSVRARRHEIGVRMALGADRQRVITLILGRTGRAVAAGLALGFLGAATATRVLERLLYEIKPTDAPTFAGVAVLLTAFALAGSYLPARRAAKVDPMESVRCD